jgi:Ice-binding-like
MNLHGPSARPFGAALTALTVSAAALLLAGGPAGAAIVPTVGLGTAGQYAVLGGSTVTNTGPTTMNLSLGVSPGSAATGFPPGIVSAPGVIHTADAAALQAQTALTAAYNNAAGRPVNANTAADIGNQTLQAGVYAVHSKGAMSLTGPLVLDGAGNANSVFIFQTDSTLITASGSTVTLINGAQECNVFWQVGSSATLGTGSVFRGNILALAAITVNTDVVVHGRALARNAATTLDSDVFVAPTCDTSGGTTTTTTSATGGGSGGTATATDTGTGTGTGTTGNGTATGLTNGVPGVSGPPRTGGAPLRTDGGGFPWLVVAFAGLLIGAGTTDLVLTRRASARRPAEVGAAPHPER